MKLNLRERLWILKLLPHEGNYIMVEVAKRAGDVVTPKPEEEKECEIKFEQGMTVWNQKGEEEKEIPLEESGLKLIEQKLIELEKSGKMNIECLTLYQKIYMKV